MYTILVMIVSLVLAGCASTDTGPRLLERPEQQVHSTNSSYIEPERLTRSATIAGAPEAVWPALVATYQEDLEIPLGTVDTKTWALGNQRLAVSRRLGGERLSTFFRCGTSMTGPIADEYGLVVSLFSMLTPAPGGQTRVQTQLGATARDRVTGNEAACVSTGALEERIAERVKARAESGG